MQRPTDSLGKEKLLLYLHINKMPSTETIQQFSWIARQFFYHLAKKFQMKDCQRMTWRNDFKTKQMFSKVLERLNDECDHQCVYIYMLSACLERLNL